MTASSAFFKAIKAGDLEAMRAQVRADPELLHARHEIGVSAVLLAAYYGRKEAVELLLDEGADLDIFDASALGRLDRIETLAQENNECINATATDGFSPLGLASFFGHKAVVEWLLVHGAEANRASQNEMRVCPLHSAVANRNADEAQAIAEVLLAHGAEVNAPQAGGWTPLHQAAAQGHLALANLLLAHGADVNARNEEGETPLHLARTQEHSRMVELLAEHGGEAD
jgi:uncharacterized protein